jgi:molybdopterin/thiamine biosynthesis adenylyltransferase
VKSVKDKIFRLRASVALVYKDNVLNLFKTNVRENIFLEINYDEIIDLLFKFDGQNSIEKISIEENIEVEILIDLVNFLNKKNILIEVDKKYPAKLVEEKYRVINFLEDYCYKTSKVINKIFNLKNKKVLIVGLGAVGSWIVDLLARDGVENFIIVDDDIVEISNLHRQNLYFEEDIGKYKVDCVEEKLKQINKNIKVIKIYKKLTKDFFDDFDYKCNLIINCADFPSVDFTTNVIGKYCMKSNIPHIIGGGYNLHLTLIGQTVLPYKSACYKCFDTKLKAINEIEIKGLKKLHREKRKIGSFPPLSTIAASVSELDAFKILCELDDYVVNSSKRIEFRIKEMDFEIMQIPKDNICEECTKESM